MDFNQHDQPEHPKKQLIITDFSSSKKEEKPKKRIVVPLFLPTDVMLRIKAQWKIWIPE